jgi:hypothetical protein
MKPSTRDDNLDDAVDELLQARRNGEDLDGPLNACDWCGRELAIFADCYVLRQHEITRVAGDILAPDLGASMLDRGHGWRLYCTTDCMRAHLNDNDIRKHGDA